MINKEVLSFISRFTSKGRYEQVIAAFTQGCCYWFAVILQTRFEKYSPIIMYDYIINHFATKIGNRIYDITGDVTDKYTWFPWDELNDEVISVTKVTRDCIMF